MAFVYPVMGVSPTFGERCFLAPNATVVGDVIAGDDVSIWFNAVVRGDVNFIKIGNQVNIQDGAVIHGTYQKAGTTIGNRVSIGHNAIIHGCTLEDDVLVGMGAIVMDNAVVHSNCLIAAGAVVLAGTVCESGWLYAGTPAKPVKQLDDKLIQIIKNTPDNYMEYANWFGNI